MFDDYKDVVSVNELCQMLNIGKNTAYKLLKEKTIFSVRIGKTYKIPKLKVIEYLAHQ